MAAASRVVSSRAGLRRSEAAGLAVVVVCSNATIQQRISSWHLPTDHRVALPLSPSRPSPGRGPRPPTRPGRRPCCCCCLPWHWCPWGWWPASCPCPPAHRQAKHHTTIHSWGPARRDGGVRHSRRGSRRRGGGGLAGAATARVGHAVQHVVSRGLAALEILMPQHQPIRAG